MKRIILEMGTGNDLYGEDGEACQGEAVEPNVFWLIESQQSNIITD